ncbi:MAG: tetratricopeptide repeat protein [ANME-2 cluster archaeon]|nr:tetratricopeptide repeat protein [ANME-2 cluster archaeon]MBC2708540.1 tetratricopeptide repeat protein [ANME-2 cluster archaeon]MBC2746954.1 tetratricopeptide repeat protein [ANME-2 cluster archaeon]
MNEFEQKIVHLAETYNKPDEFINILESFRVPPNEKGNFFSQIGITLYKFSYFFLALNSWSHALKYFNINNDNINQSNCYGNLGIAYNSLGDFRKAIEYHEKSLMLKKDIRDRAGESSCYANLGNVYQDLGDFEKAIEYHEKSLMLKKDIRDRAGESSCYANLGIAYDSLCNFEKAITYFEKSLEMFEDIGDEAGESSCYANLGNTYQGLGDFEKANTYFGKSLELAKDIGDRAGESSCYANLGNTYQGLGDFRKAIEYHEKSLKIFKDIGGRAGESSCYANIGIAYQSLGDFRKAIEYHEKSLEIAKDIGSKAGESNCYRNFGAAYWSLGDFRKAIEYHEKSLEIAKDIKDRVGESSCYLNLGNVSHSLGDFEKAIEYYEKSLNIKKDIGDMAGKSICYNCLCGAYQSLGDFEKATDHIEKSLEIAKDIEAKAGESNCYINLGNIYLNSGDFEKAIEYYKKSLNIKKDIGGRAGESNCYTNLGIIYQRLGDFEKAIEYHEKSLETAKDTRDRAEESNCYGNLGTVYLNLDDFEKAIEYVEKSLEIAKDIGYVDSERIAYFNLGLIYSESKKLGLAYDYYKRSIELSEMMGEKLVVEDKKIRFYTHTTNAYQNIIPICCKLENKVNKAFEYVEKSKCRAFLDLMANTEIKPSVELTSKLKSLLDEEDNYLSKLQEIQINHLRQTKVTVDISEVRRIVEKLNQIYDKIEKHDPEYVFIRRGNSFSWDKVQNFLHSQRKDRDIVLVEYFTTRDMTFIFLISSKDNKLHVEPVSLSAEELNRYIKVYWREVVEFQDIGDTWIALGDYLIEPISEYLSEGDLIYFVPYGPLHYLPLHVLELNGKPLIENNPVAYSPSASLLKFYKNKGSGKLQSCASFGVMFEEEAEDVAELFSIEAYKGKSATKDKVFKNCTDKDIIHFSCHGHFDYVNPLSSGIELYDSVLTAREIFDLRLNTEIVTVSACQTGLNEISLGDELIGLTRALLYTGAPTVIVSLWSVDARSTQELMHEFYTQLKNGVNKAVALQEAQKKIMNIEGYSHPYYWAPFVLVGNWK